MRQIFVFLASVLVFTSSTFAAVWESSKSWNDNWEDKYSEWVAENWHVGVFGDEKSKYYGIATDCADASYAMRAIFAYEHSLPFAYRDVSRFGKTISNDMSRWDNLPSLGRLKKFVGQFYATGSTRTLPEDTVPVHVNPMEFRAGLIFVKPGKHSYQLQDITEHGIPVIMASTVPYKVRWLDEYESFPAYPLDDMEKMRDGYRRFKRPDELYLPDSEIKGYSQFQHLVSQGHNFNENDTNAAFRAQLTYGKPEPVAVKAKRLLLNVCYASRNRVDYVDAGVKFRGEMLKKGRSCMDYGEYDNFSTNSRDLRFKNYFHTLKEFVESSEFRKVGASGYRKYAKDLFTRESGKSSLSEKDYLEWCDVPIGDGNRYTVRDVWASIRDNKLISNPNASRLQRWGFFDGTFQTSCKVY